MFTGLVADLGTVTRVDATADGLIRKLGFLPVRTGDVLGTGKDGRHLSTV